MALFKDCQFYGFHCFSAEATFGFEEEVYSVGENEEFVTICVTLEEGQLEREVVLTWRVDNDSAIGGW